MAEISTYFTQNFVQNIFYRTKYLATGEQPTVARLLRSWVRIPPETWIFVCC